MSVCYKLRVVACARLGRHGRRRLRLWLDPRYPVLMRGCILKQQLSVLFSAATSQNRLRRHGAECEHGRFSLIPSFLIYSDRFFFAEGCSCLLFHTSQLDVFYLKRSNRTRTVKTVAQRALKRALHPEAKIFKVIAVLRRADKRQHVRGSRVEVHS